jgi:hypothetical protein
MKKPFVKKIVKNVLHEVSVEFDFNLEVKVTMEFDWSIDFDIISEGLLTRSLSVKNNGLYCGYTVSHGIHSPNDTKSDLLQQIICGRVADRLYKENFK